VEDWEVVNRLGEVESRKREVWSVFRVWNVFLGIKLWQEEVGVT